MFLLYRVLFCNFANNSQFCEIFLGLISCKCCNIVFFLYLLYVVFIFPSCKCNYCHKKCCNQINVIKKKKKKVFSLSDFDENHSRVKTFRSDGINSGRGGQALIFDANL